MTRIVNSISQKEKRRLLRKNKTFEEDLVWNIIRNNNMGVKFRRQVSIGPYVADFYCREKRLVIELDGIQHADNTEYDRARELYFTSVGIRTIRFWNQDIQNVAVIKEKIKDYLNMPFLEDNSLNLYF